MATHALIAQSPDLSKLDPQKGVTCSKAYTNPGMDGSRIQKVSCQGQVLPAATKICSPWQHMADETVSMKLAEAVKGLA